MPEIILFCDIALLSFNAEGTHDGRWFVMVLA